MIIFFSIESSSFSIYQNMNFVKKKMKTRNIIINIIIKKIISLFYIIINYKMKKTYLLMNIFHKLK